MKALRFSGNAGPLFSPPLPSLRQATLALCFASSFILSSSVAAADPVRLVRFGDVYTGNYDTGFNLAGSNFSFMVSQWLDPIVNCQPCVAGASLDLSTTLAVTDWAAGRATIDGHTYETVYFDGSFDFDAGSVIVPNMAPGQSGPDSQGLSRELTTFRFTGTLSGYSNPGLTGAPLFSTALIGSGSVVAAFSNYPSESGIRVLQLDYHFDNVAATPEPGSLLLFGSGAAWVAARWRRRKSAVVVSA